MVNFLQIFGAVILFFAVVVAISIGLALIVKTLGAVLGLIIVVLFLALLLTVGIWLQSEGHI